MFLGALSDFNVVRLNAPGWVRVRTAVGLVQLGCAIVVLLQRQRRQIGQGMQRVAIALLVLIGLMFAMQSFSMSFIAASSPSLLAGDVPPLPPAFLIAHRVAGGVR